MVVKERNGSTRKNSNGFSLVELLVVIIILGILAGIAVLGFSGAKNLSQKRACEVDFASVSSAIESYKSDFPNDDLSVLTLDKLINENYLEVLASSPKVNDPYPLGFRIVIKPDGSPWVQTVSGLVDIGDEPEKGPCDNLNG